MTQSRHHRRPRSVTLILGRPMARTLTPVPTGNRHHNHHPTGRFRVATALLTTEQVTLTVQAEDAAGVAVADPGARTWASSDETVATVSVDATSGVATVVAVGVPGTATVTVTDVEPAGPDGAAGQTFVGSVDFIVSAPADPITQIVVEVGTPTPKAA